MRATILLLLLFGFAGFALPAAGAVHPPAATSCTACHSDPAMFEGDALKIPAHFANDVHASVGLSCQDCHGGNPDPKLRDDPSAMDPGFAANPYRGAPARVDVPAFCGRCHSDPVYMKRFRPDIRVDQEREYRTSHHGVALAQGDGNVATCVDCHGVHGIRRITDPASPVYPKRVAETCRSCHGDPKRMAGYKLPDGRPLPVDQYAHWRQSVHAQALLERNDLSAPTCNDCHGNHGATPPGVDSVAFVCGQCHGREAELFRASAKRQGFEGHNELLASVDGEGCAACHSAPEPQAAVRISHFTECVTCHGNHAVVRTSLARVRCTQCHGEGTGRQTAGEMLARMQELTALTARAERNLLAARRGGVETRHALSDVDGALDAQVELKVLVHTFASGKDSAFAKKQAEGVGHARAALAAGQRALAELAFRRKGLAVSLGLIVMVLVGLALKIREIGN